MTTPLTELTKESYDALAAIGKVRQVSAPFLHLSQFEVYHGQGLATFDDNSINFMVARYPDANAIMFGRSEHRQNWNSHVAPYVLYHISQ